MLRRATMPATESQARDLADNLIESLGPLRAAHVAHQYGWREVAREIAARVVVRADTGYPSHRLPIAP